MTMSTESYLITVAEEVERHRRPDGTVDEEAVAAAVFARSSLEDAIAAFLERARSREHRRGGQLRKE
jgi:hypothetical protein